MSPKLTKEFISGELEKIGWKFLDETYVNNTTKFNCECSNGHVISIDYSHFKRGHRCSVCSKKKKYTLEQVKKNFEERGWKLLSTTYQNIYQKLEYTCDQGHNGTITFTNFLTDHGCAECAGSKKKTLEEVTEYFESRGYTLLSDVYISNKQKLEYMCPYGHIGSISLAGFQCGGHGCNECFGSKKKEIDFIRQEFEKVGYKLLSTVYVNSHEKLSALCNNNHKFQISWTKFNYGRRCCYCYHKNEQRTREIFEDFFGKQFIKCRPNWLEGLELDGYCEDLGIAFEYNGKQHYEFNDYFHEDEEEFQIQVKRDQRKKELCEMNSVKLYVISCFDHSDEAILAMLK